MEHFYRAIERPYFSERDWSRLPRSLRQAISDVGLQLIWDDVADAIEGGTFEARVDRHLSRYPLVLDERGWEELGELLTGIFDQTVKLEAESAARLAESGEQGLSTKLAVMLFESPDGDGAKKGKAPARKAKSTAKS